MVTGDFNGDGHADVVQANVLAGSLSTFLSGDEGIENGGRDCQSYAAESNARGTKSTHVNVPGRDHFTLLANLALRDDPGRIAIDAFLREQLDP